ncbi:MAG: helix-turn-helix transcriptional regulator [Candidatus Thiodiazotropha endolucinida]
MANIGNKNADVDMQERSSLMTELQGYISRLKGTQAEKANSLAITQPRLNDLLRGRVEKFSLDALTTIAVRAGLHVSVRVRQIKPLEELGGPSLTPGLRLSSSPFPVRESELGSLSPGQATVVFRELLRCEAFAAGLSPMNVVVSLKISIRDGGIDAKISGLDSSNSLLLKEGEVHYQIKTGSSFKPWQPSSLKKELFGEKRKPNKRNLAPAIKDCLDAEGCYTITTFGHDLQPHQHTAAKKELASLLQQCGYKNPSVEVMGQGQLAGEIEKYPSLCLSLFGFSDDAVYTLNDWKAETLMQNTLHLAEPHEKAINEIRSTVLDNDLQYVRVVGEPGIGKTRGVLEAVSHTEIAPTVVYVPTGDDFQKSRLFKELIRSDRPYAITVVIDDCEDRDRASIWSSLKGKPEIKLITIDHGPSRSNDLAMRTLHFPALPDEQVKEILTEYIGKSYDAQKWAEVCGGSPRVAHAVGENLKNHPEDILRPPATVPLWERFIKGNKAESTETKQYGVVLRHVALFQKFGFEVPVSDEGRFIASLVQSVDPSITWGRFQAIIQHFRARRILQGNHTLFLVPKALHVYLWRDFWDNHGRGFDFSGFMESLPSSMRNWFFSLFIYADEPPAAKAVVKSVLGNEGPFKDESFLTSEFGPRFIRYLAEADPESTLQLIERTYGNWANDTLLNWQTGRQDIVWALEIIAVWEHLFQRAANVLIRMALAENASNSNNSKGTLIGLFTIGLGWAPTQAPPILRFPLLKGLLQNTDIDCQKLGLEMAKGWLSTYGGSRIIGPEHQGLKPTIEFWRPSVYGEVYDAWRDVWRLLISEMAGRNTEIRQCYADTLIKSAHGLMSYKALSCEVIDTLFLLAEDDDLNRKSLTHFVISYLGRRGRKTEESILRRLIELNEKLTGSSLWNHIERYVLHSNWDEDYVYENDEIVESDGPKKRVKEIATKLLDEEKTFTGSIGSLLRSSGHRLPSLGYECGLIALSEQYDQIILQALSGSERESNGEFLGGYLGGVREIDEERWERITRQLLMHDETRDIGVECVWRSGLSENLIQNMQQLYVEEKLSSNAFNRFSLRLASQKIPEHTFKSMIETLLSRIDDGAAQAVVFLVYEYYFDNKKAEPFPQDLVFRVLTCQVQEDQKHDTMYGYYWYQVGEEYITQYPGDSLKLLEALLSNFSNWDLNEGRDDIEKLASKIVEDIPDQSWQIISMFLEDNDTRCFQINHWLGDPAFEEKGGHGPIRHIPAKYIIEWIKRDPKNRIWKICNALPKTLDDEPKLTAMFIEEFADDQDVAGTIMSHFYSGGWSGPESAYLEKKRNKARHWSGKTESLKIRLWLDRYIDSLTRRIDSARIQEERQF